jgi:hypothetical protein
VGMAQELNRRAISEFLSERKVQRSPSYVVWYVWD